MQLLARGFLPAELQIDDQRLHLREQAHETDWYQGESSVLVAQHRRGYQERGRDGVFRRDHVGEFRDQGVLGVASVWLWLRVQGIEERNV